MRVTETDFVSGTARGVFIMAKKAAKKKATKKTTKKKAGK